MPLQCFFFSSRRRHTRYIGDWSSDVCSSDLFVERTSLTATGTPASGGKGSWARTLRSISSAWASARRSEERRVGKEWRWRWWPYEEKKRKRRCKERENYKDGGKKR